MGNGAMYGVVGAIMKHTVDGKLDIAIAMCKKILEELEARKAKEEERQ